MAGKSNYAAYRNGADGLILWAEERVWVSIYPIGYEFAVWVPLGSANLADTVICPQTGKPYREMWCEVNPETGRSYQYMWEKQKEVLREALVMEDGKFIYRLIVFCWPRGEGKCQEKGSKVLMFDGSVKKVEDVVVGDLLMGDDNTPRKVLSLANGKEKMVEVVPYRGESMIVTEDHILSLKRRRSRIMKRGKPFNDTKAGNIVDISVKEYQKQNRTFKDLHLLYRVPIDCWKEQDVPIDPYFFGLWLGDGHSHTSSITTMDREVVDYLYKFASNRGMKITIQYKEGNKASEYALVTDRGKENPLLTQLHELNLYKNKHIPALYKINSREIRLKVLAGIVDSDGYINRNSIQITLKSKQLSDDIVFLARSLGFHVIIKKCTKRIKSNGFSGEYYRIGISGDCSVIPTIIQRKRCCPRSSWKDVLVTGIKEIKPSGVREYYGFTLDGNGRYVTGDFTVTHNSFLAVLILEWKWFCWPKQDIRLCANSKEQTGHAHLSIAKDTILNSPRLLKIVGKKNILEKEIRLRDARENVVSKIEIISSASGIFSNINGYAFSEIFELKNRILWDKVDGNIRNVPNAFGVIDSTVSSKEHLLYILYDGFIKGKDPLTYFSYRCSEKLDFKDYWHPNQTQAQLNSYKSKQPLTYAKQFKNLWSAGAEKIFSTDQIEAMNYMGAEGVVDHRRVIELIQRKHKIIDSESGPVSRGVEVYTQDNEINQVESLLWPVSDIYILNSMHTGSIMASHEVLDILGDMFDTEWAIIAGIDRAQPFKRRTSARTLYVAMAKGLQGSRSNPDVGIIPPAPELEVKGSGEYMIRGPAYIYFYLQIADIIDHSLEGLKNEILLTHEEFDGVDMIGSETWGVFDLKPWAEALDIEVNLWQPSYARQLGAFTELFTLINDGRLKTPPCTIPGAKENDIVLEEMNNFDHDDDIRWFGSPEKNVKGGIQDDFVYATGWCIYGGRELTVHNFRPRLKSIFTGTIIQPAGLVGDWL